MSHIQIGRGKIYDNVYDTIGNTPLVRLNKLPEMEGIKCEILCKLEFMNPGGSVKDRNGKEMFLCAEKEGKIKPGDTIIEASSGNFGIGVGLMAACKGYKCIICMPERMSQEKADILKGLGCEIIRTPTEARSYEYDSHHSVARRLCDAMPNSFILNQYSNENNWKAHYNYTGKEILVDTDNKLDYFVAGAGTGGTMTGCSKRIKEVVPDCKIIVADPYGSRLTDPEDESQSKMPKWSVEGIGYDFVPKNCERDQVDHWV